MSRTQTHLRVTVSICMPDGSTMECEAYSAEITTKAQAQQLGAGSPPMGALADGGHHHVAFDGVVITRIDERFTEWVSPGTQAILLLGKVRHFLPEEFWKELVTTPCPVCRAGEKGYKERHADKCYGRKMAQDIDRLTGRR